MHNTRVILLSGFTKKLLFYINVCLYGEKTQFDSDIALDAESSIHVPLRTMLENESITSFFETFDNIRKESKAFNNELLQKNKVSKEVLQIFEVGRRRLCKFTRDLLSRQQRDV